MFLQEIFKAFKPRPPLGLLVKIKSHLKPQFQGSFWDTACSSGTPYSWDDDGQPVKKKDGKVGQLQYINQWNRVFPNNKWVFKKWDEIDNPKTVGTFSCGIAFGNALQKKGFKRLGSGAFSTVYGKDGSDRVVKVTHRPDNWIDYIYWAAKKGYTGNLAPKVFSYKKIGDFSVAIVEKMEHTVNRVEEADPYNLVDYLLHYQHSIPQAAEFVDQLVPGLNKFVTELRGEFGHLDLHRGNYMVRKDGSFVVTDPVASESTSNYKRLRAGDFTPAQVLDLIRKFIEGRNRYRSQCPT